MKRKGDKNEGADRENNEKDNWGVLGAALGLSLSLLFLPLEVQAATQCDGKPCKGYTDSEVEHDHDIKHLDKTFYGGTVKRQVWTYDNAVIEDGTFQDRIDIASGSLTIKSGSFLSIVVYGEAIIEGGTFGGNVQVSKTYDPVGKAEIRGGTFKREVVFASTTSGTIEGGVFEERVLLESNNVTIKGGTFLGGVQDKDCNSYTFPGVTYHTINFEYSDGTSGKQIVVGNSSISVNPNGGEWLDEATKEEYIFGRSVDKDLTLIEVAHASEGGGGTEAAAERLPEGSHITCEYEWVTVREAGAGVDGEEWYQCKHCGRVEAVQIIPAASYQTARLYEAIGKAQEAETITYDLGNFHTITDTLLTTLQNRSDVTLVLTFTYQNRCYETTFPKGTDYTELLEDEDFFYGLLGLNGRSGIVTQDVTP